MLQNERRKEQCGILVGRMMCGVTNLLMHYSPRWTCRFDEKEQKFSNKIYLFPIADHYHAHSIASYDTNVAIQYEHHMLSSSLQKTASKFWPRRALRFETLSHPCCVNYLHADLCSSKNFSVSLSFNKSRHF